MGIALAEIGDMPSELLAMGRPNPLPTLAAVGLAGAALFAIRAYRRDMARERKKLAELGTAFAETPAGEIEYRSDGTGPPVLVLHGIWGGSDQGLINVGGILDESIRRIVVSRFGYLRSPMPNNPTVVKQANLFAALLDHLGLARTAIIAHSAGTTSALQFAIRYPDRVSALVLVSPNAPGPVDLVPPPPLVGAAIFRASFVFWLLVSFLPKALHALMGVPRGLQLSDADKAFIARMARSILPSSARAEGALFDAYVGNPAVEFLPLEQVRAPTLVVAAQDDPLALFANSAALARSIPGAELLSVERGGHMLLGQAGLVEPRIRAFLRRSGGTV